MPRKIIRSFTLEPEVADILCTLEKRANVPKSWIVNLAVRFLGEEWKNNSLRIVHEHLRVVRKKEKEIENG